jgi:hypothetical protein
VLRLPRPVRGLRLPSVGRAFLAVFAAPLACAADPAQDAWEVIADMAAALGRASAGEFLAACDSSLPGLAQLRSHVNALVAASEVESSIDPVANSGNDASRSLEIDWLLHLVDRSGLQKITRRREVVKARMEKRGRKWKVVALEPLSFFAPPSA